MTGDRKKFLLFLVLLITLYFSYPLFDHISRMELLLDLAMTCLLVWALFSIGKTRFLIYAALLTALPIPLARLYNEITPAHYHEVVQYACLFLLQGFSCVAILTRIVRSTYISTEHIFAAVGVYLLSCFMWADAFAVLEILSPGSFKVSTTGNSMFADLLYFSTTCVTTNSYGDVIPLHPFGRALAAFVGCTGQLYIALILAYLVGLHGNRVHQASSSKGEH